MASNSELKRRKVANGNAKSHPPLSKLENLHTHGSGHTDDEEEHGHAEAGMIWDALRGRGDRGSQAALYGLFANIGLTGLKGVAGWYLNSASLIADAGHSLSDLLGDLVTIVCYTFSQRPPSMNYPYGYGKFESLGTIAVAVLLILGGFGVGLHSYGALLTESIEPLLPRLSPDSLSYSILLFLVSSAPSPDEHDHTQSETTEGLSPVALFFPILSIIVKEWLYRLMSGIAKETGSSVLLANALHHRSDAWGSLISLLAIFGGIFMPGYGVDPLGGIFVGIMILISGVNIFGGAIGELTDTSIADSTLNVYSTILDGQSSHLAPALTGIRHIRGVQSGGAALVDVVVEVAPIATAQDVIGIAQRLEETLRGARKEVKEVRVRFELHRNKA